MHVHGVVFARWRAQLHDALPEFPPVLPFFRTSPATNVSEVRRFCMPHAASSFSRRENKR
jgi:hypothetical protein